MFICAGNTFLTSKVHSFRKMELTVNIEWTSISSLVQIFEVVHWPYITKACLSAYNQGRRTFDKLYSGPGGP